MQNNEKNTSSKILNSKSREELEESVDVDIVFALLSGRVTSAMNRKLSQELSKEHIAVSAAQSSVLFALWHGDGVTQKQLSDTTYKDKPSITRLLDNMEKEDLVKRQQDPIDRRINKIYLTEKAKKISEKVFRAAVRTVSDACMELKENDVVTVQRLLKTVFRNLENSCADEDED